MLQWTEPEPLTFKIKGESAPPDTNFSPALTFRAKIAPAFKLTLYFALVPNFSVTVTSPAFAPSALKAK